MPPFLLCCWDIGYGPRNRGPLLHSTLYCTESRANAILAGYRKIGLKAWKRRYRS